MEGWHNPISLPFGDTARAERGMEGWHNPIPPLWGNRPRGARAEGVAQRDWGAGTRTPILRTKT